MSIIINKNKNLLNKKSKKLKFILRKKILNKIFKKLNFKKKTNRFFIKPKYSINKFNYNLKKKNYKLTLVSKFFKHYDHDNFYAYCLSFSSKKSFALKTKKFFFYFSQNFFFIFLKNFFFLKINFDYLFFTYFTNFFFSYIFQNKIINKNNFFEEIFYFKNNKKYFSIFSSFSTNLFDCNKINLKNLFFFENFFNQTRAHQIIKKKHKLKTNKNWYLQHGLKIKRKRISLILDFIFSPLFTIFHKKFSPSSRKWASSFVFYNKQAILSYQPMLKFSKNSLHVDEHECILTLNYFRSENKFKIFNVKKNIKRVLYLNIIKFLPKNFKNFFFSSRALLNNFHLNSSDNFAIKSNFNLFFLLKKKYKNYYISKLNFNHFFFNKIKNYYFYTQLSNKIENTTLSLHNFFNKKTKKNFFFSKKEYILVLISNPFLFKKEFFFSFLLKNFVNFTYSSCFSFLLNFFFLKNNLNIKPKKLNNFIKNDLNFLISSGNVIINSKFFLFNFKRYVTQSFDYRKLNSLLAHYPYQTVIKFVEYCSGKKALLKLNPFIIKNLDSFENAQCVMWARRLRAFKKMLGPRLFLSESLQIILLSFKLKDPYLLSNWMLSMFYKISFWKYKMLFRYMQYVLKYLFWPNFDTLGIKGIRFQLKGKVSVAGNARTRTVRTRTGSTSHATFKYKVLTNLNLIKTFTGVIGFRTWLVF